ncbi:hypothetical protein DRW03_33480 [Corallococcus sp. H22C18031201]|nr:hypothetical protein DRW03_33480 [Corallococcus sp. H22C18031201]
MPVLKCVQCQAVTVWKQPRLACDKCKQWMAPQGRIIAQNSHQSGDTYGVGMALLVESTSELLFLTSPEDKGCMEKLAYYSGLGIEKERLGVLVLCTENLDNDMDPQALAALQRIATVYGCAVGTKLVDGQLVRACEPNQLYQMMVNPGLFDRDKNRSRRTDQSLLQHSHRAAHLPYLDPKNRAHVAEVGASTRLAAEHIRADLKKVFKKVWLSVAASADRIDTNNLAQNVATQMVDGLVKQRPAGVMLLWVRSLSAAERNELKEGLGKGDRMLLKTRREAGLPIDDLFWTLSKKRNPQHLMTPQLFETLRYLAEMMNYAVVPIGDEVLFDEYLAASDEAKGQVFIGTTEHNLINFWDREGLQWFKGPERRIRQLFLLWHLFRLLARRGIPLVQVGLRSGEMEKAAYLGVPTIYLEEAVSETGARMLPVTVGGAYAKDAEPSAHAKTWWQDANKLDKLVSGKLREDLESAKAKLLAGDGKAFWEQRVRQLRTSIKDGNKDLQQLRTDRGAHTATQLNTFLHAVTDHSPMTKDSKGGLPFFFRLTTKNVVGLYGAPSRGDVFKVRTWLRGKFEEDQPASDCPDALLRGTLTESEIDLAYNTLLNIQSGFGDYLKRFFPRAFLA